MKVISIMKEGIKMINTNIERTMKDDIYIVSSSKGLIIILLVVSLIMLYGGGSYIYDVVSKGIVGEKILYVAIWIGLFILFFGTLWNRLRFKITVERDMLKVRNIFFREREYYFNDITDYKFTNGRWNSNVNVFIEGKKIFSIDSSDNNFNRLYDDLKNDVGNKNQVRLKDEESEKEYAIKKKKIGIGEFIVLTFLFCIILFIIKYMGQGTASEDFINIFCNASAAFFLIIILFILREAFTKMIVRGNIIILMKPPFTKKYRKMSDIEKIHNHPDIIEIYMKDDPSSQFTAFSKEQYENVDIFLKQAEESGVLIKSSDFDTYNMLK